MFIDGNLWWKTIKKNIGTYIKDKIELMRHSYFGYQSVPFEYE